MKLRHLLRPAKSVRRALTFLEALFGIVVAGVIDVATGAEIQVVSLYFLPLVFVGWRLPRTDAAVIALFATLVWLGALYATGARYSQPICMDHQLRDSGIGIPHCGNAGVAP